MKPELALELAVETLHDLFGEFKAIGLEFPKVLADLRNPKNQNKDIAKALSTLNKLLVEFQNKTSSAKAEVKKYGMEITYSGLNHSDQSVQDKIDEQRGIYWKYEPIVNKIKEVIGFLKDMKG
jgi:hypothetical protein